MTEFRDVEREIGRFRGRLLAAAGFVLLLFSLLVARLVWLQVVRHDDLASQAEANRIAVVPIVPNRGLIVDRNGVVLATNYSAYTLEITPSKVEGGPAALEPLIDALGKVVEVAPRDRKRFRRLLEESKSFESLPIRTKLTDEEVARFMAQRFRFAGVDVKARLFRNYPLGETGSHLLGYIGRINQAEKKAMEDWADEDQANYKGTEYIGKLGLEQAYESDLHGITGVEQVETSAGGRARRRLASHPPTPGNTLVLSVDIKLQALVEQLYGDRRGALVALDPRTGEILAFVSKPTFDPNLFVDGIDADSWRELNESIDKPLLNRALRGTYPPGSTYKPYMALAALATGKRTPQQAISDPGYYNFGNHKFRDDKEGGHGLVDMYRSIVQSCDTYYYMLAGDLGVDTIAENMRPFGFGELTGIDIEGEVRGILPSTDWKRRAYRKAEQQRWYAGETISLGIGQGYNSFTVLQMSNAIATLATGGQRHKPHLVKEVVDLVANTKRQIAAEPLPPVTIKPEHLAVIRQALVGVNKEGTSAAAFKDAPYVSGGKTGTAQVVGIKQDQKYNAAQMAEHLLDHALYVAYAPADDPRVAVALVVENAGFGAANAAPIARRVFDYLLAGLYPSEEDLAAVRQGKATTPIGKARQAADVPLPGLPGPAAQVETPKDATRVATR
ncbi:MAG: penicillin-binding protein 2 [Rubrivivax sp.]